VLLERGGGGVGDDDDGQVLAVLALADGAAEREAALIGSSARRTMRSGRRFSISRAASLAEPTIEVA
jgi:hypothetical protein